MEMLQDTEETVNKEKSVHRFKRVLMILINENRQRGDFGVSFY